MDFIVKIFPPLLSAVLIFSTLQLSSKEPVKGYRAFVDLNGEAVFEKKHSQDYDIVYSISGFTTTHGYQFNKHFFIGGGIGAELVTYNYEFSTISIDFPIYATGRADWKIGKVPLFADLRVGTFFNKVDNDRMFIHPSIGYRCTWGRKISLNIGAGASFHMFGRHTGSIWKVMPAVKFGIEFN